MVEPTHWRRCAAAPLSFFLGSVDLVGRFAHRVVALDERILIACGVAIANLGSAAAWGKSLLGGAAAKIAATAGVFIAVTAMTPALREQIQGAFASPPPAKQSGVAEIALQPGALGLSAELQKPSSAGGTRLAHQIGVPSQVANLQARQTALCRTE